MIERSKTPPGAKAYWGFSRDPCVVATGRQNWFSLPVIFDHYGHKDRYDVMRENVFAKPLPPVDPLDNDPMFQLPRRKS